MTIISGFIIRTISKRICYAINPFDIANFNKDKAVVLKLKTRSTPTGLV
jgi:hypothetical protein